MNAKTLSNLIRRNRGFLVFMVLMVVFRSSFADWNTVPTGSMLPSIVEGDRILVDKLAYDLNVPLTHHSLARFADPQRGDVIVFDSAAAKTRLVKRVVGVPGDRVQLRDNRLIVNGVAAQYDGIEHTANAVFATEHLLGITHRVRLSSYLTASANFGPVTVPEGHYFAMGDNRDNSADSRVIGFVPRDEIGGRSKRIVMSLNYENGYLPRGERFWKRLD
jgi:signal peptidase I